MGRHLDLDIYRAARDEAANEPPTVTFLGEEFRLVPAELPWIVIEAIVLDDAANFHRAVNTLLGDTGVARAVALGATTADMGALVVNAPAAYGVDPEAQGRSDLSSESSAPSNPTSDGPTDLTSEPVSSANNGSVPAT